MKNPLPLMPPPEGVACADDLWEKAEGLGEEPGVPADEVVCDEGHVKAGDVVLDIVPVRCPDAVALQGRPPVGDECEDRGRESRVSEGRPPPRGPTPKVSLRLSPWRLDALRCEVLLTSSDIGESPPISGGPLTDWTWVAPKKGEGILGGLLLSMASFISLSPAWVTSPEGSPNFPLNYVVFELVDLRVAS